ncbi:uncharacterized protein FA14DRAFT_152180 [Meira miltonrushii]|uniref:Uncharacterized protein n=1 Tax=Meira miltonrushii TaxID=1280837 RepID=A0A316VGI8_9BASI|nr:uncharacterized protein FA14DRAFT_152180 [Meira miltonrushii]PWN36757.1 hypothetical protein FA14DRAFT_152180 [Meira miltonrushii]
MSSTPSTFARAQMAIRPKIKPKSPLRRQSVTVTSSPTSPIHPITTMFNKSPSTSSSLSGHGTLSTSTSASSDMDRQSHPATAATVKVGELELSLPLLATSGVGIFVGALLLRAIYTFSTSIVRLFVMVIAVWAFLTFSQLNDRQKERQQRKKIMEERTTATGGINLTQADFEKYGIGVKHSTPTNNGGGVGYASGYGHARYPTANATLQSHSSYASDGKTRNLLSPHQRFANHST